MEELKAIDEIFNSYDAFFMSNKYSCIEDLKGNTHEKQFKILTNKFQNDAMSIKAINWIFNCYDCYYKNEYTGDDTAFAYLRKQLNKKED